RPRADGAAASPAAAAARRQHAPVAAAASADRRVTRACGRRPARVRGRAPCSAAIHPGRRGTMPLRLNVGASRKVTDNNYGSRGASVNLELELELDASLVADSPKLRERIRELFGL